MATSKSGKKSYQQADRRRVFNLRRTRAMKTAIKQVDDFVAKSDIKAAIDVLPNAYKAIDKATKRGLLKKNTAARKKSRLARATADKK